MRIEIITTPNDELKETGFGALSACHSVLESINKLGYDVKLSVCRCLQDLELIVSRKPDLVILAVKYISINNGCDIWLSEYFAEHGVNYSGSTREVLKFDSDKVLAKTHLRKKGLKTANYFTAIPGQYRCESDLPVAFPLFLKPLDAANSNGIDDLSLVTNFAEFESKTLSLYTEFDLPVLAEEYLCGREFSVAIIKTEDSKLIVSAVEIVPPQSTKGLRVLGEKTKKENSEEIKKIGDQKVLSEVTKLAMDAFAMLGIWDYGRIDIKTNKRGQCHFMEANLVPGMKFGASYFPRACEIANELSYDAVIQLIVEKGISRAPHAEPLSMPLITSYGTGEKRLAAS
ncbi:MAG: D-alanine--D-alanine ligase [Gammaproteobacteria bacterium]|nr:D-alanine--D-alanine ligase [Gammaproteobacteria bacterium]MDH5802831.1 D-alanine--D-alanine ligase [Gammaproteobacteria bacterium]